MKYIIPFLVLGACTSAVAPAPNNVLIDMAPIETQANGRCIANDTSPAVIETVTIQEIELPELRAANGTVTRPATLNCLLYPRRTLVLTCQVSIPRPGGRDVLWC